MLIRRCAWHRLYRGYPMLYGITAWGQPRVQYTDGMCRRCAVIALEEWSKGARPATPTHPMLGRLRTPTGRAGIAVAAACILAALAYTAVARRDGAGRDLPAAA